RGLRGNANSLVSPEWEILLRTAEGTGLAETEAGFAERELQRLSLVKDELTQMIRDRCAGGGESKHSKSRKLSAETGTASVLSVQELVASELRGSLLRWAMGGLFVALWIATNWPR